MNACLSLACWPGLDIARVPEILSHVCAEPLFGALSTAHVQLVPQTVGLLDEARVDGLLTAFPSTRFRLHANVRVLPQHRMADLSTFDTDLDWFRQTARISQRLDAPAYSTHAGYRHNATLARMLDNARRCADLFGCPVAVEGLYPDRRDAQLVSTWEEYRMVFESGVPYALDLSHLNIVAHRHGREDGLVAELLACERCLEVHVSTNDGHRDSHWVCEDPPWWFALLSRINPHAVVFSEGNHRRRSVRLPDPRFGLSGGSLSANALRTFETAGGDGVRNAIGSLMQERLNGVREATNVRHCITPYHHTGENKHGH